MSRELGIKLYCLRVNGTDYSQKKIADMLHIDRSTYSYYELGKSEPPLKTVKQLTEIFGVSYEELIDPTLSENVIADYEAHLERLRKSGRKRSRKTE